MHTTVRDEQLAVLDDFLPAADFAALWGHLQDADYRHVNAGSIPGVWRVHDGDPLVGAGALLCTPSLQRKLDAGAVEAPHESGQPREPVVRPKFVPTGTPLDAVIRAIEATAAEHADVVGRAERDWELISGGAYVYPAGTGISWHADAVDCSGAFIYYAHPRWDVTFGGELLVADRSSRLGLDEIRRRHKRHHFDSSVETEQLLDPGHGRFFMPRPNRLILLAGGNSHMVSRVSPAAGGQVRASIAGFFLRPDTALMVARDAGLLEDALRQTALGLNRPSRGGRDRGETRSDDDGLPGR